MQVRGIEEVPAEPGDPSAAPGEPGSDGAVTRHAVAEQIADECLDGVGFVEATQSSPPAWQSTHVS